jgi:hypothetical protein
LKWYETDILIDDPVMKIRFFSEVETRTLPLCNKPVDLQLVRVEMRKKNSSATPDGSGSARDPQNTG